MLQVWQGGFITFGPYEYDVLYTSRTSAERAYARTTEDRIILKQINMHIHLHLDNTSFVGTYALIVTWVNDGNGSDTQLILVTDGLITYALHIFDRIDDPSPSTVIDIDPNVIDPATLTTDANINTCFNGRFVFCGFTNFSVIPGISVYPFFKYFLLRN